MQNIYIKAKEKNIYYGIYYGIMVWWRTCNGTFIMLINSIISSIDDNVLHEIFGIVKNRKTNKFMNIYMFIYVCMFVYVCILFQISHCLVGSLVSVWVGSWCGMVKVPGSNPLCVLYLGALCHRCC